jgi:predicted small lipoprotein YifL
VLLSLWAHIIEVNNMGLIFCGLWGPIYIPQLDLPTTQLNWSVGFFYD